MKLCHFHIYQIQKIETMNLYIVSEKNINLTLQCHITVALQRQTTINSITVGLFMQELTAITKHNSIHNS